MKREQLLRSREYWLTHIQNDMYNLMEHYRAAKNLNQTQLGAELGFSKGYISQILNGDFDHKISKLVDLALSFNKVPIISFVDLDKYIKDDAEDKPHCIGNQHLRPIEFNTFIYLDSDPAKNKIYHEEALKSGETVIEVVPSKFHIVEDKLN